MSPSRIDIDLGLLSASLFNWGEGYYFALKDVSRLSERHRCWFRRNLERIASQPSSPYFSLGTRILALVTKRPSRKGLSERATILLLPLPCLSESLEFARYLSPVSEVLSLLEEVVGCREYGELLLRASRGEDVSTVRLQVERLSQQRGLLNGRVEQRLFLQSPDRIAYL